jgi:hypothetical protein
MKKGGISILGILFLGIILILVLSYFNISIQAVVEKPSTQNNVKYVTGSTESLWNEYLKKPLTDFYNDIWVKFFWASFVSNMERIRNGQPTDFQKSAPTVNFK